jgi:HD-like signal output (HDOD) protein
MAMANAEGQGGASSSMVPMALLDGDDAEAIVSGLRVGARAFLKTPVDPQELALVLAQETSGTPRRLIRGFTVGNLLQLVETENKSCLVEVLSREGRSGYFLFEQGMLRGALLDELVGDEAAYEMLLWDDAALELRPPLPAAESLGVTGSVTALSLEAMRRHDEAARVQTESPLESLAAEDTWESSFVPRPDPDIHARQALSMPATVMQAEHLDLLEATTAWLHGRNPDIPIMPSSYLRLLDLTRDVNASLDTISGAVSQDQSLSLSILRQANSVLMGARTEVKTVHEAVLRLGFRRLRSVVFALAMESTLVRSDEALLQVWKHSLTCARMCSALAKRAGRDGDEAFLLGLLHRVHDVLLIKIIREACPDQDDSIFGSEAFDLLSCMFFEQAFDELVARWRISDSIASAIRGLVSGDDRTSLLYMATRLIDVAAGMEDGLVDWSAYLELTSLADRHGLQTEDVDVLLAESAEVYEACTEMV